MPNVKEQTFDRVHDTQFIYKQLLDAMTFPGTVRSIHEPCGKLGIESPVLRTATALALTLLDGEVSFAVELEEGSEVEAHIVRQTFCKIKPVSAADYIFADGMLDGEHIANRYADINRGTLVQPDRGATLFLLVNGFENNGESRSWLLSGPGISGEAVLEVEGLSEGWIEQRAEWNAEYPTGLDVVLFNLKGELAALPRTTVMKGVER